MSTAVATKVTWAAAYDQYGRRLRGVNTNNPHLFANEAVCARANVNVADLAALDGVERVDGECADPEEGRDRDTLVEGQQVEALILDPLCFRGVFRGFDDVARTNVLVFELPRGVMLQVFLGLVQIIDQEQ